MQGMMGVQGRDTDLSFEDEEVKEVFLQGCHLH